jgi:arginine/lysine/ornithine decarboxylase
MNSVSRLSAVMRVVKQLQGASNALRLPALRKELRALSETDAIALRKALLGAIGILDDSISNPYIGSIFDRTANSPLNEMLASIADAYGVKESFASTTGTTGLNAPGVMALAGEGDTLIVGRDCHVSVVGGLCLSGATPVYLIPHFDPESGVLLPPTVEEVTSLLDAHPRARAIVLTMPTYHGLMGDVVAIVRECHQRGVLVMVDEAHGPHFHFLRGLGFPIAAEDAGADLVTQSTHKVLSALNQGSLLHCNSTRLTRRYEEAQSFGFQSTSFSLPILVSLEHAIEQMRMNGEPMWAHAVECAHRLRRGAAQLPGVHVLDERIIDSKRVAGMDPTRVTLNVRRTGRTGYMVGEGLLRRGFIVEMSTSDVVLFLVSPSVSYGQIDALLAALKDVVKDAPARVPSQAYEPPPLPQQVLTPRQAAMQKARKRVPKAEAIGRVCAETIGCFPPGQAIFVAGEQITGDGVRYLERVISAGGHLKRIQDDEFQTIEVVDASN